MYTLTAALVLETGELREEVQQALSSLPVRVLLDETSVQDWSAFQERLRISSPDVVIVQAAAVPEVEAAARLLPAGIATSSST